MRVDIIPVARGIAKTLEPVFRVTYALPKAQTEASSATVVPTGGSPESRCVAALKFDVVLAAPITDFDASIEWLADKIGELSATLDMDPTCGGACTGVRVESWGEFYTASIGAGADAVCIRVTLSETNATE